MTKRKDNVTQPKIGLDIFSGAGGLSLGAEMAGIDVKYAIEINKSAAQTFRRNHKGAHVICDDITKLSPKEIVGDNQIFIIKQGHRPFQERCLREGLLSEGAGKPGHHEWYA